MGAITGTAAGITEFAGDYKVLKLTIVPASASDTVTLTAATDWTGATATLLVIGR